MPTGESFYSTVEAHVRKDRESRRPQRRGFDDDNYAPPSNSGYPQREGNPRFEPAATGPAATATVKWYNPEKDFGFVELLTGGDAFLPVSVVERSGNSHRAGWGHSRSPDCTRSERTADHWNTECRCQYRSA